MRLVAHSVGIAIIITFTCELIFKNYNSENLLFISREERMVNIALENGGRQKRT